MLANTKICGFVAILTVTCVVPAHTHHIPKVQDGVVVMTCLLIYKLMHQAFS